LPNLPSLLGLLFAGGCFGFAGGAYYPQIVSAECASPETLVASYHTAKTGTALCVYQAPYPSRLKTSPGKVKRRGKTLAELARRE